MAQNTYGAVAIWDAPYSDGAICRIHMESSIIILLYVAVAICEIRLKRTKGYVCPFSVQTVSPYYGPAYESHMLARNRA